VVRRIVVLLTAITAISVSCSLPQKGPVEKISSNAVPYGLDNTLPTTTTTSTTIPLLPPPTQTEPPTSIIRTETVKVYYVVGLQITPIERELVSPTTSTQILELLKRVPEDDSTQGLRTAVPDLAMSVSDDGSGVALVDLPTGFFEAAGEDARYAIAQIVLSLRTDGIGQVRFTLAGQPVQVPRGTGDLAQPDTPLALRDYENLLSLALPPPTTTPVVETAPVSEPPVSEPPVSGP
jgi:hypothetical protein